MKPLLSVVMPAYNGERYIAAALESVRAQREEGIEVLVVDDGSTDRTLSIVHSFAGDLSIRLLTPGRLGNWVAATNLALREATGEWACFLHQDDLWLPGRIRKLWPEMQTFAGQLILHNAKYVGPDGQQLGSWTCPLPPGDAAPELFLERLLVQNFIAIPSPVFRRKVVLESGGMNEALWFSADWDVWLRLGAMGAVRFFAEAFSAFRVHPASQTAARKLGPNEWEQQLSSVLGDHLSRWPGTGALRTSVEHAANASIAVNSALAAKYRGEHADLAPAVLQLLALGPFGWRRYFRDSRILQRVSSRLKVT